MDAVGQQLCDGRGDDHQRHHQHRTRRVEGGGDRHRDHQHGQVTQALDRDDYEIGRASCRERV